MKIIKYTEEQMNKISNLIKNISVKGDSVLPLAMVIQELNNGLIEEAKVKEEVKKEGE